SLSLSVQLPRPPRPTLFPYTTLFRSEKNFEGTVTDLQMGGYLLIRDFRQRINKRGAPYGWPISVYTTPEVLWGYDHISSAYSARSEEHTSELQSRFDLVCRLLLEKKN